MEEIEMVKTSVWESIKSFLGMVIYSNKDESIVITVGLVILIIVVLIITSIVLGLLQRFLSRKLPIQNKRKFTPIFSFTKWIIYLIVILVTFNSIGINVTAIFAASAVLLVGVGLALQTFFQDLLAGAFILMDQTVHVGDIIEIEDKVSRVTAINLRTTKAVTRDNKVLIMPNHKYLTSSLYNWTQNDNRIRESVTVGVAYGSDVQLVKKLLIEAAKSHPKVIEPAEPIVIFSDFGDSALIFKIIFTIDDGFERFLIQSDIRFEIDRLFRKNNITIPFPQRDVHMYTSIDKKE